MRDYEWDEDDDDLDEGGPHARCVDCSSQADVTCEWDNEPRCWRCYLEPWPDDAADLPF